MILWKRELPRLKISCLLSTEASQSNSTLLEQKISIRLTAPKKSGWWSAPSSPNRRKWSFFLTKLRWLKWHHLNARFCRFRASKTSNLTPSLSGFLLFRNQSFCYLRTTWKSSLSILLLNLIKSNQSHSINSSTLLTISAKQIANGQTPT